MDNNNPAEMSNEDLEKDMQQRNLENPKGNQEKLNKSSAAEGDLLAPEDDPYFINKLKPVLDEDEDSQDGSMPDPESLDNWESDDDDHNKMSS